MGIDIDSLSPAYQAQALAKIRQQDKPREITPTKNKSEETAVKRLIILLPPRTKKNSMKPRLSRDRKFLGLMQSDAYRQYETDCLKLIKGGQMIDYPVNVKALYYMPTRGKVDIVNLHSALHDVLVKAGVLADDNSKIVVSTDGSRVFYDKENPRTEIEIMEV